MTNARNSGFSGASDTAYVLKLIFLFSFSILSKNAFSPSLYNRCNVRGTNNEDLKKQGLLFRPTKKESQSKNER